jgi:hypothetical protein
MSRLLQGQTKREARSRSGNEYRRRWIKETVLGWVASGLVVAFEGEKWQRN